MVVGFCAECGIEPAKYFLIHPEWRRPVKVCANCENRLAEMIASKQTKQAYKTASTLSTRGKRKPVRAT